MLGEDGYEDDTEDEEEENWLDTSWGCTEDGNMPITKNQPYSKVKDVCMGPPNPSSTLNSTNEKLPAGINGTMSTVEKDGGLMSRMLLNDNKAGMEGLDKEKINQVILEASKGSKYFENEKKKEEQVNKKIEEQMVKLRKIGDVQLHQGLTEADKLIDDLEGQRDLSRIIVHVDMDAFYAAVEMRDDPSLKNKPMAVGGYSMLSTSNYLARKFGVRAAMPGFIGKKLCPDLIMVKPNFEKYTAVSREIRSVLADYDPNYCPMSLDEAYLDITDHLDKRIYSSEADRTFLVRRSDISAKDSNCKCDVNMVARDAVLTSRIENTRSVSKTENNSGDDQGALSEGPCPICGKSFPPYDVVTFGFSADDSVKEMRSRIEQKTQLTASAGIAPNMMLAKVCSDKNKPNGQYRIAATMDAVMGFITDLPIRKISGIGKVSEKMLNALNISTCSDLYNQRALLYHLYSPISFNYFMRICVGIGSVNVERDSDRKSMSTERTFSEISKPEELVKKCQELCVSLCEDLREEKLKGKTVAIKLKTVKYEVKTRAHTLPDYTFDLDVVFSAAQGLLQTEIQSVAPQPLRLRLMGVRISSLLNENLCRKKQQNTLTRFVRQVGRSGPENSGSLNTCGCDPKELKDTEKEEVLNDNVPCLMKVSNTSTFDAMQWVDNDSNSSNKPINPEYNVSAADEIQTFDSPKFKLTDELEFQTMADSGPVETLNQADLDPKILILPTVSINSSDFVKSSKMLDKYATKSETCSGAESSDLESIEDIPDRIEKVTDKDIHSDFRKSANAALLLDPDHCVSKSLAKEQKLQESVKGDSTKPYICPVCQDEVVCGNLSEFNQHIDICLNKKIVMDCSRYRPEEDMKTKLSKTPNAVKRKPTARRLSGSPSTPKDKRKSKMSSLHPTSSFSSPKVGLTCDDGKTAAESRIHDIIVKSVTEFDVVSMVTNASDKEEKSGISSSQTGVFEGSKDAQKMVCPVCFMEQTGMSLDEFNTHVDTCLSKGTITQILQEQRDNTKRSSSGPGPSPQAVKRKRVDSGSSVIKTKCIDSFFKK
ncbi:DNA polymerase kappa-like [Ylistrum balloti]|uniref:DNA polymerase kappa-like n=1 Tax=Ylistrum balloti TaxID=509963 RepID=UPI002905E01A|nr:DNA polymerase kappa-like [Ylistrum balloti]